MGTSYLSPGLCERESPKGVGTYAVEPFRKGAILSVGGGDVMTREALEAAPPDRKMNSVQITADLYIVPNPVGPGDHINHSCDPNAGFLGQIVLVALRDINVGEEICYDYAMTDTSDYDEFACLCGTPSCRGRITGNDWKLPALRERYRGYFSPHVASLIGE